MNFYTVKLEQFHIDNTRSRHNDTDTVTLGVQLGEAQLPILSFNAGDVNNGDHGVGLHFSSMLLSDPDRPLAFSYTIYNGSPNNSRPTSPPFLYRLCDLLVAQPAPNPVHLHAPNPAFSFSLTTPMRPPTLCQEPHHELNPHATHP